MSPRRTLTAGHLSRLRELGDAVRRAADGDRGPTILLAVTAVREHRAAGAGFDELARALGVEIMVLRDWLDQHARAHHTKPTRLVGTPPLPMRTRPAPTGTGVLVCTGDPRPAKNDFATEVRAIRDRVDPRFAFTEHTMIEVGELPGSIRRVRPRVLHIAAHSQGGAVFLTRAGDPISVQHAQLAQALLAALHQPSVLVLNFCRSIELVANLRHAVPSIVCWPDRVDDGQCREMADILYRALGGAQSVGTAMDAVRITLPATEPLLRRNSWVTRVCGSGDRGAPVPAGPAHVRLRA